MLSKLKVFFLVVTCSLSLGLGFLLPVFSSQKTTLAVDSSVSTSNPPVFDAAEYVKDWTNNEKQVVFTEVGDLLQYRIIWFVLLFSDPVGLIAIDPKTGKDAVYKFDQFVFEIKQQIEVQKKFPYKISDRVIFDYTKLTPLAQNQFLQFFEKQGAVREKLRRNAAGLYIKNMVDTWNSLQPLFYQMWKLNYPKYQTFLKQETSFTDNIELYGIKNPIFSAPSWDFFKDYNARTLKPPNPFFYKRWSAFLFESVCFSFAQQTLINAIDDSGRQLSKKLKLLQSAPDLASLTVDDKSVDVSSLTSSDAQSIADLNKKQIDTLLKLKDVTAQDLQQINHYVTLISDYKEVIQPGLSLFAKYGINTATLNDKEYQLDQLLNTDNLDKPVAELSPAATRQLTLLFNKGKSGGQVSAVHFQTAFNDLINLYRDGLKKGIELFKEYGVENPTLNGSVYQITNLQGVNLVSDQDTWDYAKEIHDELSALYKTDITPDHFTVTSENNQKLDALWTGIKGNLWGVKYANLQGTDLQFANKITTNIDALFVAAKDKKNFIKTGFALTGDALVKLQELVAKKITAPEVNAALAVAKVQKDKAIRKVQVQKKKEEKAKPKKPVAKKPMEQKSVGEKTKETKKVKETKKAKDKKTALTIGLATGGGVLLLAGGAGGFLYWFYKIKK